MELEKAIAERRSTRSFCDTPVERDKLEKIARAGLLAPSGMNEQPWLITVVTNGEILSELNAAVKKLMSKADEERIRSRSEDNTYCFYYRAPVLAIVSCGQSARFPREDAACALENMFLTAHDLGLGSCWINQLCGDANDSDDVRAVLDKVGISRDRRVYGCAAIGYIKKPTELKPRSGAVEFF